MSWQCQLSMFRHAKKWRTPDCGPHVAVCTSPVQSVTYVSQSARWQAATSSHTEHTLMVTLYLGQTPTIPTLPFVTAPVWFLSFAYSNCLTLCIRASCNAVQFRSFRLYLNWDSRLLNERQILRFKVENMAVWRNRRTHCEHQQQINFCTVLYQLHKSHDDKVKYIFKRTQPHKKYNLYLMRNVLTLRPS